MNIIDILKIGIVFLVLIVMLIFIYWATKPNTSYIKEVQELIKQKRKDRIQEESVK